MTHTVCILLNRGEEFLTINYLYKIYNKRDTVHSSHNDKMNNKVTTVSLI